MVVDNFNVLFVPL